MVSNRNRQFQVTEDLQAPLSLRLVNYIIDLIVQVVIMLIVATIVVIIAQSNGNKSVMEFFKKLPNNDFAVCIITYSTTLLYYNLTEIFSGRTLGKLITQTIVVDEHGDQPHYERIMLRSISRLIPFYQISVLILGRGCHDIFSKTYVVKKWELDDKKRKFNVLQD